MLKVYRKESQFKGEHSYFYSATNSKGISVTVNFDKDLIEDIPDKAAFTITNIKGNAKEYQTVDEKTGETFTNMKYYVKSCEFGDMPVYDLDE